MDNLKPRSQTSWLQCAAVKNVPLHSHVAGIQKLTFDATFDCHSSNMICKYTDDAL